VPDLRRLHYFLTVAEERNFTRAAQRLHIAQPALSRQVRLLEEELGVELLHRTTHQFELTEAGRFLLERGPALLSTSEELWRSVSSFGSGERGAVIVAYGASASYGTAPRLLTALAERLPQLVLTTEVKPTPAIIAAVTDGSVDVGLLRCPPQVPELEVRTVRREPQGVLVGREHRLASFEQVDLTELSGERVLLHPRDANPGHYDAVLELCRRRGIEPHISLRAVSFDLAQTPVARGDAVAIVGESTRIGLPQELRWLPLKPPAELEFGLVTRRYGRSPALDQLLEAATAAATDFGWLQPDGHTGAS
jgi:DNA-binding transcriptional LysR family regulator